MYENQNIIILSHVLFFRFYRLIQEVRFDQRKTMIGQLVNSIVEMFENQCTSSDSAKLLVVLSDGRGIFSEGTKIVNNAIRRAKLADIFLVFIVVDNPVNKVIFNRISQNDAILLIIIMIH